jgi:hypothetical protein
MRLKEFIIFIIIFTIIYILFFIIYDKLIAKKAKNDLKNKAIKNINITDYGKYAMFYGITTKLTADNLQNIFTSYSEGDVKDFNILETAQKNMTNPYEIAVIISYFEYIGLVKRRTILINTNSILETSIPEQNLISKYFTLFQNNNDVETIKKTIGETYITELTNINDKFLFPGVRFINNNIYYFVGDNQ